VEPTPPAAGLLDHAGRARRPAPPLPARRLRLRFCQSVHGDTHISLDKIANATIRARDLRVRLQFEGHLSDLEFPETFRLGDPIRFSCGSIVGTFCVHSVAFADRHPVLKAGRDAETAWVDLLLYSGPERQFDFGRMKEAALVFTLSMVPATAAFGNATPSVYSSMAADLGVAAGIPSSRRAWFWQRMNLAPLSLTIPNRPLATKAQRAATEAQLGRSDPWKSSP
jgi:hypothetical protein